MCWYILVIEYLYTKLQINHLCDQSTFTPVGTQGGFMEPPLKKTTFPPEFCNEICTIYVWTIKNHNSEKKKKKPKLKLLYRFKMVAK